MTLQSILESISELIRNPTSNLAATSLGFAIVVVFILILIMIALIALVPRAEKRTSTEEDAVPETDGNELADEDAEQTGDGAGSTTIAAPLTGTRRVARVLTAGSARSC